MTPAPSFRGQVVLVTGATSGIGETTARWFGAAGARVVLAGRRHPEGEAIAADIVDAGGEATFVATDLRDPASIEAMVAATVATYGRLDHAFNNAGIFDRMHDFHSYDDDAWNEMISVNLTAVFRCMKHEIAAMLVDIESGEHGRCIVNNASTVAHRGSVRASPAYVASKHGVLGLTRHAAVEYVDRGIRVNAVSPGPTRTAVSEPLVAEGPAAVRAALESLNPTGEFVTTEEVAAAVLFLCSPEAKMINGTDIPLDGGQLAGL